MDGKEARRIVPDSRVCAEENACSRGVRKKGWCNTKKQSTDAVLAEHEAQGGDSAAVARGGTTSHGALNGGLCTRDVKRMRADHGCSSSDSGSGGGSHRESRGQSVGEEKEKVTESIERRRSKIIVRGYARLVLGERTEGTGQNTGESGDAWVDLWGVDGGGPRVVIGMAQRTVGMLCHCDRQTDETIARLGSATSETNCGVLTQRRRNVRDRDRSVRHSQRSS